jgi:uncharacterized protein (TIGR03792 family)
MIVEHLTICVPVSLRQRFLALDAEIWTQTLSAQPGFLGKEVWVESDAPETVHLMIRWTDRTSWKAVPAALLQDTDRRFAAALGLALPVLCCTEHQVLG